MRVARHKNDIIDFARQRFERTSIRLVQFVDDSRATGRSFSSTLSNALSVARYGSVLDGKTTEVGRALRLAADASACLFAGVSTASVRPLLGGQPLERLERSDDSLMDATTWIEAFFLNALCRSDAGLLSLAGVPLDVLRASRTKGPLCREIFADALQGLMATRADTFKLLVDALDKTDPDKYSLGSPDWVLHFDVRQIHLICQIIAGDPEFETGLAEALQLHKKYWSRTEELRNDPDGFLAINLLGIATLAYEKGIPFDIDSEYLPMDLVDGSFLKM